MELLGQRDVSLSDLQRLDRQGAFEELDAPSGSDPVVAAASKSRRD